jgi:hypothetical protein
MPARRACKRRKTCCSGLRHAALSGRHAMQAPVCCDVADCTTAQRLIARGGGC